MSASSVRAGRAYVLIEAIDKTGKVLMQIRRRFRLWGEQMISMGMTLARRAIAALSPLILSSKIFMDFDDAMRRVEARSRGTVGELDELRSQARALGRDTSSTATEVAKLQAKLAQKGYSRSEIFDITPNVRNLSRAAGDGINQEADSVLAADLVSGTLKAYKMGSDQAAHVSDVFTAAVNNSNFSLQSLLEAMRNSSTVSNQYGMSLEDTVAVLGQMVDLNIDASSSGVALRNMLLKASDSAKGAKFNEMLKAATGMSIQFQDASGNLRPLPRLMAEINAAMKSLGSAQQGEILTELFGLRTIVGASAVTNSMDSYVRLAAVLSNVDGEAERVARTMDSGLGGTWRRIKSAVTDLAIEIGEQLAPAIQGLEADITGGVKAAIDWINANRKVVVAYGMIVTGALAYAVALIAVGYALKLIAFMMLPISIISWFVTLSVSVLGAAASLLYFNTLSAIQTVGAMIRMGIALAALTAKFVVFAFTVAVGVVDALIWFSGFMVGAIALTAQLAVTIMTTVVPAFMAWIGTMLTAEAILTIAVIAVLALVGVLLYLAGGVIIKVISGMWNFFNVSGNVGQDWINIWLGSIDELGGAFSSFWAGLKNSFSEIGVIVQKAAAQIWGTLTDTFGGVVTAMELGDTASAWQAFTAGLELAWMQFVDAAIEAWVKFSNVFLKLWADIANIYHKTTNRMAATSSDLTLEAGRRTGLGTANLSQQAIANVVYEQKDLEMFAQMSDEEWEQYKLDVAGVHQENYDRMKKEHQEYIDGLKTRGDAESKARQDEIAERQHALADLLALIDGKKKLADAEKAAEEERLKAEEARIEAMKALIGGELKEGLPDSLMGAASGMGPEMVRGLEKGSVEAAQQGHKNRFQDKMSTLIDVEAESRDLLKKIEEGMRMPAFDAEIGIV